MIRAALIFVVVGALLSGCAARGVVVGETSLWPFQKLAVRTSAVGVVTGYFSRPQVEPRHLVIVLQTPLCQLPDGPGVQQATISTGGVLWEQFAKDSAFLQFERPVTRRTASADSAVESADCEPKFHASLSLRDWQRAAGEVIATVRKREGLAAVPTIYLGVGAGAMPALGLADKDRRTATLVLIGKGAPVESATRARAPVVIVQGSLDDEVPMAAADARGSRFDERAHAVSMLMFRQLGRDLGLSSGQPECFEMAMQALANQARAFADGELRQVNDRQQLDCPELDLAPDPNAPLIQALPRDDDP